MEDMAAFDTSTIAKDYSGGSGSVLTDHDEAFADYACDHGAIPSPAAFMRAGPEMPSSSPRAAAASSSHHKKSGNSVRRSVKKKVVSVPIAEIESIKGGGGDCTPPPDAWTWRKYGQKPIKGSPYPRGYYRCSSSKGCPARKQVERSRVDPSMIVVTYASDHNHTMPAPRGNVNQNRNRPAPESAVVAPKEEKDEHPSAPPNALAVAGSSSPEESTFTLGGDEPPFMTIGGQFYWFSGLVETPLPSVVTFMDDDDDGGAGMFPAAACGEDDALFAELGELPECSVVFRRPAAEAGDERRCNLRRGYGSDEVMIK